MPQLSLAPAAEPATTPVPVEVTGLTFTYAGAAAPALVDLDLVVPAGSRCLLVGPNGAGKSTLLQVLGGRHLIPPDRVKVLGRPAFHDTELVARVALLGGTFHFDVDCTVADILAHSPAPDPERLERLEAILRVDRGWHMHRVSDGQRRRVQLLLGLLQPSELLLLDEITADLDVVARADLLRFLRRESQARALTILHATHILDAMEEWATHLALLDRGRVRLMTPIDTIPELGALREAGATAPLYRVITRWLRDLQ